MEIKNRKALFEYEVIEKFVAGIVLKGCEVKSLRKGSCSLSESYITYEASQIVIRNMHIAQYQNIKSDLLRPRILLLNKREKKKLITFITQKGQTCVPLQLFWTKNGLAKLEIACAVGKKIYDKRRSIKEKEIRRTIEREIKRY